MMRDVDSKLVHHRNRIRTNIARQQAGAENLETIIGHVAQQPLGHLAARHVTGAKDQNALFFRHRNSRAAERALASVAKMLPPPPRKVVPKQKPAYPEVECR